MTAEALQNALDFTAADLDANRTGRLSDSQQQHMNLQSKRGKSYNLVMGGVFLVFAIIISGIGALVLLYASAYLAGDALEGHFYLYLLFFMASMLGVVLANNLITLFVFWELTSLSSYLLIGFRPVSYTHLTLPTTYSV